MRSIALLTECLSMCGHKTILILILNIHFASTRRPRIKIYADMLEMFMIHTNMSCCFMFLFQMSKYFNRQDLSQYVKHERNEHLRHVRFYYMQLLLLKSIELNVYLVYCLATQYITLPIEVFTHPLSILVLTIEMY